MIPLAIITEGKETKIHCVDCGRGLRAGLCDLGLQLLSPIKVDY